MKKLAIAMTILALAALITACSSTQQGTSTGKVIKSAPAENGLTVRFQLPMECSSMETVCSL